MRRPRSLRGRVVVGVLALLAVLLATLFVVVDLLLGAKLRADLRTRLTDRVALAEQLDGALTAQDLVDRLKGDGVSASLCTPVTSGSRQCVTPRLAPATGRPPIGGPPTQRFGGPLAGPARGATPGSPSAAVEQDGSTLFVRTTLPRTGEVLSLAVDTDQISATVGRLVLFEVIGGALALAVAALLLGRVVGLALRPLDHMTGLARSIAGGDRGRRLRTGRPDTELGRTATAFDAMLDELESALSAAADAQARLRDFLSDASHELRSPLAGLQATAELLLRDEPGAAERERAYLALIRETRRASRLVDDLLTVTRLDSGAPLALERTDLVAVAAQEAGRCRLLAPGLDVVLAGRDSAPVDGDPIRLGQIVANLLDNARHATSGSGTVRIGVSAQNALWRMEITDSGIGIAAGDEERIFGRLTRIDASRTRHTGGFGLGLPIARALARAHGGELVCEPYTGGARFVLTVPIASAELLHPPHDVGVGRRDDRVGPGGLHQGSAESGRIGRTTT